MPSWKDIYGQNNFLNLERLGSKTVTGEILNCDVHTSTFKGKENTRLVIDIKGVDGRVSLNQESCTALSAAWGDDSDEWIGKRVQCKRGIVKFGKGNVPAILVTPLGRGRK